MRSEPTAQHEFFGINLQCIFLAHRPPLPLRRQYEPELVQPHGHVPFGGLGIASCAPCDGTQYEPDEK
jgi:hypothetical protein